MSSHDSRSLTRCDGMFEIVLGALLAVGGAARGLTRVDIPVGQWVLIAFGVSFLAAGSFTVAFLAARCPRRVLTEIAWGNAAFAVAAVTWLAADPGFSAGGRLIVGAFACWKAAIAALQVTALGRAQGVPA